MSRLPLVAAMIAALIFASGCGPATRADATDISGVMPPLSFSMVRVNDSARVDAQDYRSKTVLLYFGYTHCPDECPTTLANIATALGQLGPAARNIRVLFVSVDPARDTIPILGKYVRAFAPQIDGLTGSENAIAVFARRFRVLYSVAPTSSGHPYEVTHSDSVFVFGGDGRARYVLTSTKNTASLAALIAQVNS
jgi:protein SCO1/2